MLKWGLDRSKSPGSASHLRSAAIQSPNQCLPQWLQRAKEKMSWGAPLKKNLQWPVQSHDMPCRWHCWFGRDIELRFPGAVLLIIAVEMIKHGIFLWTQPVSKCLSCAEAFGYAWVRSPLHRVLGGWRGCDTAMRSSGWVRPFAIKKAASKTW